MLHVAASLTNRSRLRLYNRESVGNAMAFSCTVVSTTTRSKLAGPTAPLAEPACTVNFKINSDPCSPIRFRQRLNDGGSSATHVGSTLRRRSFDGRDPPPTAVLSLRPTCLLTHFFPVTLSAMRRYHCINFTPPEDGKESHEALRLARYGKRDDSCLTA